jgi:hypothetical protein
MCDSVQHDQSLPLTASESTSLSYYACNPALLLQARHYALGTEKYDVPLAAPKSLRLYNVAAVFA